MIRFFIQLLIISVLTYLIPAEMPWYASGIPPLLVMAAIPGHNIKDLFAGFLGVFFIWAILAFQIDQANQQLLSSKMAKVFSLPNSYLLILLSALIGGLLGLLSAWTGQSVHNLFRKPKKKYY